jgi:hypothetical protein
MKFLNYFRAGERWELLRRKANDVFRPRKITTIQSEILAKCNRQKLKQFRLRSTSDDPSKM